MRRLILFSSVLLALLLSIYHVQLGVHTDEAKYLLGIPYPHPPLFQFLLSSIDGWAFQEQFLRLLFAFALLSGSWIVWQLSDARYGKARFILVMSYFLAPSVLLYSGTVFMSVLTSIEFLLFLYLYDKSQKQPGAAWIPCVTGFLWLVTLSTALQGVLIAPLVFVILRRTLPGAKGMLIWLLPILVFFAMLGANPLSLASFAVNPGHLFSTQWRDFIGEALKVWLVAGGFLSILGTFALLLRRDIPVLLSFAILCGYILASPQPYYAVLPVPFLVFGCTRILDILEKYQRIFSCITVCSTLIILYHFAPSTSEFRVRSFLGHLPANVLQSSGVLMISGYFGHDWQYESSLPVRKFSQSALNDAIAVICIDHCKNSVTEDSHWKKFSDVPFPVYIRSTYIP